MAKTLMSCELHELEHFGVEERLVKGNAPSALHHKTLEAAQREGFLPTVRTVIVPQTTAAFRFYDPTEVQAFYEALEGGWKPTPKARLNLQFRNLSQEDYQKLYTFAAQEGIEIHVPTPRKRRTQAEPEVVEDDAELEEAPY